MTLIKHSVLARIAQTAYGVIRGFRRQHIIYRYIVSPDQIKEVWREIVKVPKTGSITYESVRRMKEGSEFPVEISFGSLETGRRHVGHERHPLHHGTKANHERFQ